MQEGNAEASSLSGLSSTNGAGVVVVRTVAVCVVLMLGVVLSVRSGSLRRWYKSWLGGASGIGNSSNPIRRLNKSFANRTSSKRDC